MRNLLLRAGVPIVEPRRGLEQISDRGVEFFAAPVKVKGMGALPVRALARLTG